MTPVEFAGLALAVVGLVFAFETPRLWFLRFLRIKRNHVPSNPIAPSSGATVRANSEVSAPLTIPVVAEVPISPITVSEIVDAINAAPPFQRQELSKQYTGIRIKWEGYLGDAMADPRDQKLVRIKLNIDQTKIISYSFWLSEREERIPDIKSLPIGSRLLVVGKIESASGHGLCVSVIPEQVTVLDRSA